MVRDAIVSDSQPASSSSSTCQALHLRPGRLLVPALLLVALAARLIPGERPIDDAYITFRYARDLVDGVGFVYNPGEPVLGTTTPLYTILLTGLSIATRSRDFPQLAVAANAFFGALSVGLLYALARRLTGHPAPAVAAALLWALAPFSVTFAVGGMETDLAIGLLLAAALAHASGRHITLAIVSALALLTRPDTAILLGLLWIDQLLSRRRLLWREALVAFAVLAPWLAFGTIYFGSPLTTSMGAKADAYRLPSSAALVRLLQHYATPFFEQLVIPVLLIAATFVLYAGLSFLAGRRAIQRDHRAWPIVAYPLAYLAVFAIANPLLFRWYLSPPLPFYFLLITGGVWALAVDLTRALTLRTRSQRASARAPVMILILFTTVALCCTLNSWEMHPNHGPDRPAPEMAWFELELLYSEAADFVLASAQPDDTLCAGDIGVLGYRTGLRIVDTVGLVTPESSSHYPADPALYVTNYAIPADLVASLNPDYIVILEVYGRLGLLPDRQFRDSYVVVERIETDIYGSDGMLIFGRAR
jgi:arabinofuranosyltransferase